MGSNNEYEHIDFWTKVNIKLNQDQESIIIESDKDGKPLVSCQFIVFDMNKLFCKEVEDNFLKQCKKDTEQMMYPNLNKKNDTRNI